MYIWFLFFRFALEPSIIPPLVINLVNSSKEDVVLDATVEFELLEGARVTLGTTTATGVMDLIPAGSEKQEFITIPAESSLLVGGYFRQPERLLPIMEKGNTDIMLRIYKGGGGIIINMNPFRFDKGMLEKYRMDLEVSQ
ncbi:MAG: hypothetical protein IPL71_21655 [Anaerolineales bacterium]|uniref:hypothetical protein n=1 Tax=Candidatus Villigracilis proximus TaxID=3140683 RepID=UPI003134EE3D|nr:hypothetical protein [Anaerolineales bacterium]